MTLSIIIPIYNVEDYLAYCLDSLLSQNISESEYEILLIDDGSTDSCPIICKKYATQFDQISYYRTKNEGVSAARNKGISIASGSYIFFVDPDDYLVDDILFSITTVAVSNELDILQFQSATVTDQGNRSSVTDLAQVEVIDVQDGPTFMGCQSYRNQVWSYLFNRNFILNSGVLFLEGRWVADAIFTSELLLKARRVAKANIDVYRYRVVPNSAMTTRKSQHYLKVIKDIINNVEIFDRIIETQKNRGTKAPTLDQLKNKQAGYVFAYINRAFRSTLPFKEFAQTIKRMKHINAYPVTNFMGRDKSRILHRIIRLLYNNQILLFISFKLYRLKRIVS